jgi:hypothetical protein
VHELCEGYGVTIASVYTEFALREARGLSLTYERLSLAISSDHVLLELLERVPPPKRQPNLLLGVPTRTRTTPTSARRCGRRRTGRSPDPRRRPLLVVVHEPAPQPQFVLPGMGLHEQAEADVHAAAVVHEPIDGVARPGQR